MEKSDENEDHSPAAGLCHDGEPVSALALESSDNNTAAQEATVITTPQEFATMTSDGAYRLGADITVDVPYAQTFTGSFDGAYHTVTLALHVTADADDTDVSWGLFRVLNGAVIQDLRCLAALHMPWKH